MDEGLSGITEEVALSSATNKNLASFNERTPVNPILTPGRKLAHELQTAGADARVVDLPQTSDYSPFSEIVINNDQQPNQGEPLVRVYRGITQPEAAIVNNQASYALRTRNDEDEVVVEEEAKPLVKTLTEDPNYANLKAYYEFMQSRVDDKTKREVAYEFSQVEEAVLNGGSVRAELSHRQIWFNGGFADTGIAPYVAVSWKPEEALGYAGGRGALLVIDLPVSEMEPHSANEDGEGSIKGWIDPKRITAVIPYRSVPMDKRDKGQITQALDTLNGAVSKDIASPELTREKIRQIFEQRQFQDQQKWPVDVEAVRQSRVTELQGLFPEMNIDIAEFQRLAHESGVDVYTFAKQRILDGIDSQMETIGYPDFIKSMKSYDLKYDRKDGFTTPIKWDSLNNEMISEIKKNADRLFLKHQDLKSG